MAAFLRADIFTYVHHRMNSNYYLERVTNLPHMNNAFFNLIVMNEYHQLQLNEEVSSLILIISNISLLATPKGGFNLHKYESLVYKTKTAEMECTFGEVEEKRDVIDKRILTRGRQL